MIDSLSSNELERNALLSGVIRRGAPKQLGNFLLVGQRTSPEVFDRSAAARAPAIFAHQGVSATRTPVRRVHRTSLDVPFPAAPPPHDPYQLQQQTDLDQHEQQRYE